VRNIVRRSVALFLMAGCLLAAGCFDRTAEWALADISGWDLTACWGGMGTCYELFVDNQENILGGQSAIDALFP